MNWKRTTLALAVAAGTCMSVGSAAHGQQLINISGATLLENYVKAPASTNDFIDVDGNGIAGSLGSGTIQQLAGPSSGTGQWTVQYRVVGSVNGFKELTQFGYPTFVTTDDADPLGILGARPAALPPILGVASFAYNNRVLYINNGTFTGAYNQGNPGGAPNRAATNTNNRLIGTGPAGGITVDIAPLDVSTKWATQKPGAAPEWTRTPLALGYGLNPRLSVAKDGSAAVNPANPPFSGGLSSFLAPLNGRNLFDPAFPTTFDTNTIFDTELAFAPIAPVVNLGTGVRQVKITELQYLFGTGRAKTGENFVVVTRDVGSGTRNAFNNCIGLDPSWGVGDNIGLESTLSNQHNLGLNFYPSNKGSNGGVESTLRNHRLGIGYVGTERGVTGSGSGSWLTTNALEIADVQNDIYGGTGYVRPTVSNIVNNNNEGWVLGGQSVLASLGDPAAEPVAAGGDNNGRAQMVNKSAASYLNNIRKSIQLFNAVPNSPQNDFMPGELAATQFLLLNALDKLHDLTNPVLLIPNPTFNSNLKTYTLTNNVHTNAAFTAFNTASTGRNPTRTTGTVYSDGVLNGNNYIAQNGSTLSYGSTTSARNKLAYDFNGDGLRTTADAADMVAAYRQRTGGPAWIAPDGVFGAGAGNLACIEILGDGDGNGSFGIADVRYWADGLALNGLGNLDRKQGFIAVDNASLAGGGALNFFGTVLANSSAAYTAGASRADLIGSTGRVARGWAPVGADNRVDGLDIDYVYSQIRTVGVANPWTSVTGADWSVIGQAIAFDLSADINGDLKVDRTDVAEMLTILGTCMGDVNLDGVINTADRTIVTTNTGMNNVGWAGGDVNGDGTVNAADLSLVCPADFNCDGVVAVGDIFDFLSAWFSGSPRADFNGGGLGVSDIFDFLSAWFGGAC